MVQKKYSESISGWYDRIMEAGYYDHKKIANAIARILGKRKRILELGIGTGLLAEELIARGYEVTGIDITPSMLKQAQVRLGSKAKLYGQDILKLNLPETYEAAISQGGIWYYARTEKSDFLESHIVGMERNVEGLIKLADVLISGGLLILGIQSAHRNFGGLKLEGGAEYSQRVSYHGSLIDKDYFVKKGERQLAHQHYQYQRFNKRQVSQMMRKTGFTHRGLDKTNQFHVFVKE